MAKRIGFELWDDRSRNLLADYETKDQALNELASAIERYGEHYVDDFSLIAVSPSGKQQQVASGAELATLIQSHRQAYA